MKKINFVKSLLAIAIVLLAAGQLSLRESQNIPHLFNPTKPSHYNFQNSNHPNSTAHNHMQNKSLALELKQKSASDLSTLNQSDQTKFILLMELLKNRNDNDSRLDQDFISISKELSQKIKEKYFQLRPEDRNGRGLIVYIIVRNLNSASDAEFVKKIFQETPCLSLENCQYKIEDTSHHSAINQTTLIYPQLVALHQLEYKISQQPHLLNSAENRSFFIQILTQAENYDIPQVRNKARAIREKFDL